MVWAQLDERRHARVTRRMRRVSTVTALVALCAGAIAAGAVPAGATSVPGAPGTPVAVALQTGAALRWTAPGDVGSPPLTQYRIEVNGGSGWSTAEPEPGVQALVPGGFHTCALLDDGTVKCWGMNDEGQLGVGDSINRGAGPGQMGDSLPPVALGTGRSAVALTAGQRHTCALLDDGTVKCWGQNFDGQLGLGDTASRGDGPGEMGDNLATVALGTGRIAVAIAAGGGHTCALLDDSTVKCWGSGGRLGLGDGKSRGDGPGEMGDNLPAVALGTGRAAVALVAGALHTCALLDNGLGSRILKCWGDNGLGQLGLGNFDGRGDGPGEMGDNLPAVQLGTGRTAIAVATRNAHSCALLDDSTVKCWGYNAEGELGLGDTESRGDGPGEMGDSLPAVSMGAGRTAVSVSAGFFSACALLDNGAVKCWGNNDLGQLGLSDTASRGDGPGEMGDSLPQVPLGAGRTAATLSAGGYHTCVVLDDGAVKCWGFNDDGELGLGDTGWRGDGPGEMGDALPAVALGTSAPPTRPLVPVPGRAAVVRLASGSYQFRVVALNATGESTPSSASAAVTVSGVTVPGAPFGVVTQPELPGAARLTWQKPPNAGASAVTDYEVSVYNGSGGGPTGVTGSPTRLVGSAATTFAFSGLTNGTSYRFRIAARNATGTGPQTPLSAPVIPVFTAQVSAGGSHSCEVNVGGRVRCWGRNNVGQLGDGTLTNRTTSVLVTGLSGAAQVAAGGSHSCARLSVGRAKCWGANGSGQLGDNSVVNRKVPVTVTGLSNAIQIATGGSHTCARLTTNTVKCWGANGAGQLGNDSVANQMEPVPVSGLSGVTQVVAGGAHTCALLSNQTVKCWGLNSSGQLGDNSLANAKVPVAVSGLSGVTQISAGGSHTCARLSNGTAKCWGANGSGQLGNNSLVNQKVPVTVSDLAGALQVAAGGSHTCARLSNGTAKCWGANGSGQLGNNSLTNQKVPVTVSTLSGVAGVAAGGSHSIARMAPDGGLRAWGLNTYGQVGDSTVTTRKTPVTVTFLG